jgi:5-methylthioadenosine/S-adenosylhomocysteine deaminase
VLIKAKHILPVNERPIDAGFMLVNGEHIHSVGKLSDLAKSGLDLSGHEVVDFGEAIVVPGFFNLHAHLDYTEFGPMKADAGFISWIMALTKKAFAMDFEAFLASAQLGARMTALSGVTFVCDCSPSGASLLALRKTGLRGIVGLELFGIDPQESKRNWQIWNERKARALDLASQGEQDNKVKLTVSPHAPYTVSPYLWSSSKDYASEINLPVLTHLAESKQEHDWICGQPGEIDQLLAIVPRLEGWRERLDFRGKHASSVKMLKSYNLLNSNVLAAHAVHLDEFDLNILAEANVKLVHCPRSNLWLGNGVASIENFVHHDLEFGFGTDSLSSNKDLNILKEVRFARRLHGLRRVLTSGGRLSMDGNFKENGLSLQNGEISWTDYLYRLTLGSAKLLGLDNVLGSLESGKLADFAVFKPVGFGLREWSNMVDKSALELLFSGLVELDSLFVGGKPLIAKGSFASDFTN